ncbi:hypothetical protein Tco_0991896 [Tanacetum coccineum]|uniref:Uncharacterized protein n=1 Tax=Tanacetum coccineum TaxID=301880 RepID=A0ABQ5F225_9ASTR
MCEERVGRMQAHNETCAGRTRGCEYDVLAPTPLRSVPGATVEPPRLDATSVGSSEDADGTRAESEAGDVDSGLNRKRTTSDDGAGTSKRVRHVSLGGSTSIEEETPDAPPTLAATEVPSVLRVFMPGGSAYGGVDMVTAQQAALGGAAGRARLRQTLQGLMYRSLPRKKWHCLSSRVEELVRCWRRSGLINHGVGCLAAMSAIESQESRIVLLGMFVMCALARGKADLESGGGTAMKRMLLSSVAVQSTGLMLMHMSRSCFAAIEMMNVLPHIAQLEHDQDYPIDMIIAGLTLARHATEGTEAQPDYFLKPDVAPLKESLEAHAIRLAKKKGVKGKAILCGVGAAHIPRSDGVPVSVATVSPKDSELLGKLEEAGDAAYQVGSSGPSRCHSI